MGLSEVKKTADAALRGDIPVLKSLLNAEPELAKDPRVINSAALHGQVEALRVILSAGADPDALLPSQEGYRPLHRAIEHRGVPKNEGHRAVVELLLESGASLQKRSTWRQITPLAVAGMVGDTEIINLLVERGAEIDVFGAIITADVAGVRRFIRKKSAPRKDVNNMTLLHYAALSGLGEKAPLDLRQVTEALLDAGANGNASEQIGTYPAISVLHFAAGGNFPVAEVLLHRGCNPNLGFGNSLWGPPGPMAELFLEHDADVNLREENSQPILHSRIHWNLTSVALWLLKNGADPNLVDEAGNTALHEAADRGINPKVVQAILEKGGKKHARNKAGQTPLDLAKMKKREKLMPLL